MTAVRSVCPYCGVGCGVRIETRRGRISHVMGDPDHPTNHGGLCAKGKHLAETVRTGDRLLRPLVRDCAGDPFRPEAWPDAIGRVAGAIRRARDTYGPESIALYLSGQLLTEDYYVANKLGKGLIGTPNVDTNSRLCMASTVAAYKRAFGADGPPGSYEDLDHARDVLIIGSNLADTHPILFGRLLRARDRTGARWTVVDPRRTPSAAQADEHLAIRPGSDVALLQGMAAALLDEGRVDEAAVREACHGFEGFREAVLAMRPARAAELCGVPEQRIRELARRFARSPAALSLWCQGLNQSSTGTDKISALIDLHLLTGQIHRPGAGPFSLTGQANAMGGREVGAMATELAAHRAWDDLQGRAEVEAYWGLGGLPPGRGLTAVELVDAIQDRRVRVLWVVCTNPLASLPDGRAAARALADLDLLVVQDLYHPTDTSRLAHVLLPAAGWAEKTGTLTSSERRVALAQQAVEPPGEARPDWRIFAAVGAALGAADAFGWRTSAEVFDEHVGLTAGRDLDMTALSHADLEREGPQQWPFPAGDRPQERRHADGCPTPDGRPRLTAVTFREPAEAPSPAFPLRLTTGRERDSWHTLTRTGRVAALRPRGTPPAVVVHPLDAERASVEHGAAVLVSSPRGSLRATATVDDAVVPGTVFLPFHAGPLLRPDGWVNALPARALDPTSFQPELKHTVVRVEPAGGEIALAGGALADAVAARLRSAGTAVHRVSHAELRDVAAGVLRVGIGEASGAGIPWWEVAAGPPPAPADGVAVLDCAVAPEPLAALSALRGAGWAVAGDVERWLPPPVRRLVGLDAPADGAAVRVGAPVCEAWTGDGGALVLDPGGRWGAAEPVSGDPAILSAFLLGHTSPRGVLRRLQVPVSAVRTLVLAGDPVGDPRTDGPQGVDVVTHEDTAAGSAQVWRMAAGQVLGVAAVLAPDAARDVEALWLADPEPDLVRRRLPIL